MDYIKKIEENKEEMISFLQKLIKIKSIKAEPYKTKTGELFPFGENVQKAYELLMDKAKSNGMITKNIDNYGGHIDYIDVESLPKGKRLLTLGIPVHLDVVPAEKDEGEGWKYDPFEAHIEDGVIYGRGTIDDKGPLVATFFAMKALKESGFKPKKNIRLVVGLDEETGWSGMEYYKKYEKMPDFGFSPDGDFPADIGEKGLLVFEIAKKIKKTNDSGIKLRKISGGKASNMVPDYARALIRAKEKDAYDNIRAKADEFNEKTGIKIYCKGIGKSLELSAHGKSAHAAVPEIGENAISKLMSFLKEINFDSEDCNNFIDFYNQYIGFETDGSSLQIKMEDDKSGPLTLNAGQIFMDDQSIRIVANVRCPITRSCDEIYKKVATLIGKYELGIVKKNLHEPIYYSEDNPLVKKLVSVYQEYSGDKESKPIIMGGISFARTMDNCICFGGLMPQNEDLMHQVNERISIDNMMDLTKIYANAIYELSKDEEII